MVHSTLKTLLTKQWVENIYMMEDHFIEQNFIANAFRVFSVATSLHSLMVTFKGKTSSSRRNRGRLVQQITRKSTLSSLTGRKLAGIQATGNTVWLCVPYDRMVTSVFGLRKCWLPSSLRLHCYKRQSCGKLQG